MESQRVFTSRFVIGTRTTTSFPGYSETRMRRPTLWAAGGTAATLRPNLVLFVGLTVWEGEAGSAGRRGAVRAPPSANVPPDPGGSYLQHGHPTMRKPSTVTVEDSYRMPAYLPCCHRRATIALAGGGRKREGRRPGTRRPRQVPLQPAHPACRQQAGHWARGTVSKESGTAADTGLFLLSPESLRRAEVPSPARSLPGQAAKLRVRGVTAWGMVQWLRH